MEEVNDYPFEYWKYTQEPINSEVNPTVDCAKKSNKMSIVAARFGKKLGEEFTVKYQISKYKWCIVEHFVFTDRGLTCYGKRKDAILRQLLTGQAVIVDE